MKLQRAIGTSVSRRPASTPCRRDRFHSLSPIALLAILLLAGPAAAQEPAEYEFVRGDINSDGLVDAIGDAIAILSWGFVSGSPPPCFDAADVNDDGFADPIGDAIYLLAFGFTQGPPPHLPFPLCGSDPTADLLDCEGPTLCGPANSPPVITSSPPLSATEHTLYSYPATADDPDAGDALAWSLVEAPAGASVSPASGLIEWTPSAAQLGEQDFVVRVSDLGGLFDEQSFTVVVEDLAEPPEIVSIPETTATEGLPYEYDVAAIDPDAGSVLAFELLQGPEGMTIDPASGIVSFTPSPEQSDQVFEVEVRVSDPTLLFDTQSYDLAVQDVNQTPVITTEPPLDATEGEPYAYAPSATDADPGDTFIWSLAIAPAGASIDPASGLVTWTPDPSQSGPQDFTVTVTDDGVPPAGDSQSFTVNVADVNQAPVITTEPPLDATEGEPYAYAPAATDADPGDALLWSLAIAPAGASIDPASGLIAWTPSSSQSGPQGFTVMVTDDGVPPAGDSQSFTVDVADVNLAPVILSTPEPSVVQGVLYLYDVEAADEDPADTLTYSLVTSPAGAAIDPLTGLIEWLPGPSQLGPQDFTVTVTDDGVPPARDSQDFTVEVVPSTNVPPAIEVCSDGVALVGETVTCLATASDANAEDTLVFSLPFGPAGATIDPATGSIEWTPGVAEVGAIAITVRVTDDGAPPLFAEASFTVTVFEPGSALWRIDAGGASHTDTLGRPWEADIGCVAGCANVSVTQSGIAGAADPTVYRTHRWFAGTMEYELPVPEGLGTTVRLHFANIFPGTATAGARIFDVAIEGVMVLDDFDVVAEVGHLAAHIEEFAVPDHDGTLDIDFIQGIANNPLVSGIEVLAGPPANEPPVLYTTPVASVFLGMEFTYDAGAYDPNGDPLSYSFAAAPPAGATIDRATGAISWLPDSSHVGLVNAFAVRAEDADGSFDEQLFAVDVVIAVPGSIVIRVNCGGPLVPDSPLDWAENSGTGASGFVNTGNPSLNVGMGFLPDGTVPQGTPLQIFESARWDAGTAPEMTWTFPLGAAGDYEVRLYFSENWEPAQAPGVRIFDVLVEGALFLDQFDPFVEAGGILGGATMRSTIAEVADGVLTIDFLHVAGGNNPSIKAIEVLVAP